MTAEILGYSGLGLALLLAIALVVIGVAYTKVVGWYREAMSSLLTAERVQDAAEVMRDQALAAQKKAEAERDAALAQLAAVEKQRNELATKEGDDAAKKVEGAPDGAAALADLDRVLGVPTVPGVPDAATAATAAAGADHGHAGSDAVQPATVAGAADPGRHPAG